jgi:RNA polymerase sigma-70 factor (ECF subfamily)
MADGPDPDVALMLAVQEDRPGAFEELVGRHASTLVGFFFRRMGTRDVAEDLAQETFLKVFRARHAYEPRARFRTWLLTIATNVALNRKRYDGYRYHLSLDTPPQQADGEARPPAVRDRRAEDPGLGAERAELRQRVRVAVLSLPENQRLALVLFRFEGLSYQEVGEVMGLGCAAVKSLMNRAKTNLRERLEHDLMDWLEPGNEKLGFELAPETRP